MSRHGGGGGGRGERGHPGHNGRDGRDGNDGPAGPQGPQGEKGCAGDGGAILTLEPGKRILLPRGGKIRKLFVAPATRQLGDLSYEVIVLVNGEATELRITGLTPPQAGSNKKHYVRVDEGDILDVSAPPGVFLISVILE